MDNRSLLVVTHTAPPHICGMSDYCCEVARGLAGDYSKVVLGVAVMPEKPSTEGYPFRVSHWESALREASRPEEAWDVLLNYTPSIYAKSGYPWGLISSLARFKANPAKHRLFFHIHETWHGGKLRLHHAVRDWLTRKAIGRIGKMADRIGTFTEEQKVKLESGCGFTGVGLIPVGSNIVPDQPEAGLESLREPGDWIIFGLAHTRLWALEGHLDLLKKFRSEGRVQRLITVGPANVVAAERERTLAAEYFGPDFLVQRGSLSPKDASRVFLRAGAALIGQSAGSLRKSGSFSALAAHAVPVICEVSETLLDPPGETFFCPTALLNDPDSLHGAEAERKRRELHAWFWSNRSWAAVARQVREWMNGVGTG